MGERSRFAALPPPPPLHPPAKTDQAAQFARRLKKQEWLFISIRGINKRFWYQFECLGGKANIFTPIGVAWVKQYKLTKAEKENKKTEAKRSCR